MKVSPWILGACALVPIAGAVAGASVNTTPLAPVTASSIPEGSPIVVADASPVTRERLPDHYDMQTPEGLVEVHELRMRGQHRDQWRAARAYEARYEADLAAMESRWAVRDTESRAAAALDAAQPRVPENRVAAASAPAPLDLEEPVQVSVQPQIALVAADQQVATSRMVEVSTTLDLD